MNRIEFKTCIEGTRVTCSQQDCTGTITRISKDHNQALVQFDNGDREWVEYLDLTKVEIFDLTKID